MRCTLVGKKMLTGKEAIIWFNQKEITWKGNESAGKRDNGSK